MAIYFWIFDDYNIIQNQMQFSFKQLLTFLFILFSAPLFAQDQGLDERINEAFTPIANWWGANGGRRDRQLRGRARGDVLTRP